MNTNTLPFHRHLRHPRTGKPIQAVGLRRNGTPIWPVMGGDGNDDDPWAKAFPGKTPAQVQEALTKATAAAEAAAAGNADSEWGKLFGDLKPDAVKEALDNSRKWEGRAKTNKEKADQYDALAKLVTGEGDEPDAAKLKTDLESNAAQSRADKRELAVLKRAGTHGADAARLADSRTFMSSIDALDPTADDFGTKVDEAIKTAVAANEDLKVQSVTTKPRPVTQQGNPSEGNQGGVKAGAELFSASRPAAKTTTT